MESPLDPASAVEKDARLAQCEAMVQQLQSALASNRRIGAAVGVVMASLDVDYDVAFAAVVRLSQNSNRRVADVAEVILNIRRLPEGM